jgi:hypothetical protein
MQETGSPSFSHEAKMTNKFIKASLGIAGAVALIAGSACTASEGMQHPGTAGVSGSAGAGSTAGASGTAGANGTAGAGTAGTGAAGTGTAGTGTAGTGAAGTGAAGTGTADTGAAGAGTAGTGAAGAAAADDDVLERGKRPSRDGHYVQPTLTTAAAMKMAPDTAFNTAAVFATATTATYASPLYLSKGPGGKGIFIAATAANDVKTFDDAGAPVWTRSFGASAGGTVNPKGVMSTPVIDPAAGADGFATIYACAPSGTGGFHYELHAMSAKDGTERTGWPAKLDGTIMAKNDGLNRAFTPGTHGQRPALSLVSGVVYIGFGGPLGDFSTYFGWVIAVDTKSPATIGAWSTRQAGAAIWAPGGFASDGNGVLITTGNYFPGSYTAPATYGDGESIIRISGLPTALTRSAAYYPERFKFLDSTDQDFGSSSVMLLNVPGSTPSNYAVTESKDGHLYFVDSAMLGAPGGGGQTIDMILTPSNHSARVSPVAYTTATGIHVAVTVDRGELGKSYPVCPATPAVNGDLAALMGFTVTPGSPIKVTLNWCTNIGGPTMNDGMTVKNRSASPLVTTTNGTANPIIWVAGSMSQAAAGTTANILYGVDGETGAVLYHAGNCPGIRQWTTPIAVKGHIVVGGDGHLCSWSPQ